MSVCFLISLPNGEYSNRLIGADFCNSPFSGKTSLLVKSSDLLTFPDDNAKNVAVYLSNLY